MPRCAITTSWDDGSPADLRLADLLQKHGLEGTFYVPLRPDAPVLNRAQIAELSKRFEIGAHTVRHVPLTRLPAHIARAELTTSRSELEQITGKECTMFCFPQGKHARRHLRFAKDAGFLACRTVALMSLASPVRRGNMLVMPTTAQVYSHSASGLMRNCIKRGAIGPMLAWLSLSRTLDWVRLAEAFLERALTAGGVFHLWGHSWEIDRFNQWNRLDAFLRTLGCCRDRAGFVTNGAVCRAAESKQPNRTGYSA